MRRGFWGASAAGFLLLGAAGNVGAQQPVRVSAIGGSVEVQAEPEAKWAPATVGLELHEGAGVRTLGDGRAELVYPDRTKVWLKENSSLSIETQRSLLSRVSLLFGSIKAVVPHLTRNRRMEFKTPTAVAAVRGTNLTVNQNQDGTFDLNVLFGSVELRINGIPQSFLVPQGQGYGTPGAGQAGEQRLLNRTEEVQGLENWEPGLTAEQRIQDLEEADRDRAQIHEFAAQEEARQDQIENLLDRVKEEDLAAGRTLNDVHGNLVRVDQRLLRPSANEIQIVNLVKRPEYKFKGTAKSWIYNGPTSITNRLDSAQVRWVFGGNLPEDLSAWPGFFADHEPLHEELIFANQTDGNNATSKEIFEVALVGDKDPVTGELKSDLYVGRVTCTEAKDCLGRMREFTNASYFSKFVDDPTAGTTISRDQPEGSFRDISASRWWDGSGALDTDFVWLAQENYVITNDGAERAVTDFTNTESDPFSVLRETAFQTILSVKKQASGTINETATGDFGRFCSGGTCTGANARNIDLVVAPDLGLALLQRIAADIGNFQHN